MAAEFFLEESGKIRGRPKRKTGFVDKIRVVFPEIEIEEFLRLVSLRHLEVGIDPVCLQAGEPEGIITEGEDGNAVRIFLIRAQQLAGNLFRGGQEAIDAEKRDHGKQQQTEPVIGGARDQRNDDHDRKRDRNQIDRDRRRIFPVGVEDGEFAQRIVAVDRFVEEERLGFCQLAGILQLFAVGAELGKAVGNLFFAALLAAGADLEVDDQRDQNRKRENQRQNPAEKRSDGSIRLRRLRDFRKAQRGDDHFEEIEIALLQRAVDVGGKGIRDAVHHGHIAHLVHRRRFVLEMDAVLNEAVIADHHEFGSGIEAVVHVDLGVIVQNGGQDLVVREREVIDAGDRQGVLFGKVDVVTSAGTHKMSRRAEIVVALIVFGGIRDAGGRPIGRIDRRVVGKNDHVLREGEAHVLFFDEVFFSRPDAARGKRQRGDQQRAEDEAEQFFEGLFHKGPPETERIKRRIA